MRDEIDKDQGRLKAGRGTKRDTEEQRERDDREEETRDY